MTTTEFSVCVHFCVYKYANCSIYLNLELELTPFQLKGSSKNLMSSRCAVDLFGRLHINFEGILTYVFEILGDLTDEDAVQMGGRRFLEVPLMTLTPNLARRKC